MEICDQCGSFGEIQSLCVRCGKIICAACSEGLNLCENCRGGKTDGEGACASEE